jgi:hypothetical protein
MSLFLAVVLPPEVVARSRAWRRADALRLGFFDRMSAAAPATCGVAAEVPGNSSPNDAVVTRSGPTTSGLTRLSAVGPREL